MSSNVSYMKPMVVVTVVWELNRGDRDTKAPRGGCASHLAPCPQPSPLPSVLSSAWQSLTTRAKLTF